MTTRKKPREIAEELNVSNNMVYLAQKNVKKQVDMLYDTDGKFQRQEDERLKKWKNRETEY